MVVLLRDWCDRGDSLPQPQAPAAEFGAFHRSGAYSWQTSVISH